MSDSTTTTSESSSSRRDKHWVPLESNPDLINKYLGQLGLPPHWTVSEIFGLDESLLAMVPQPVRAVILCYPITANSEAFNESQSQALTTENSDSSNSPFYVKQTVGNACGTIALIHSVLNDSELISSLDENSFFKTFYRDGLNKTSSQRAELLESDESLESSHQSIAAEATSDVQHNVNDNLHFIALINYNGKLFELDGRKLSPINHGETSRETLLQDSVKVCQQFMERDPGDIRFTMLALTDTEQ